MEVSVSTGFYHKRDYKEILDVICETQCKNIELFLNQAFYNVPINELEKEISKRDLKVLSIHTPLEFLVFPNGQSEEFWIKKSIDIAKIFNSNTIVSHMVYEDYSNLVRSGLDEIHKGNLLKYKDYNDICITTENLPLYQNGSFLGQPNEFLNFIRTHGVGVTFDTTHCAHSGFSIVDKYTELSNHVKNIHLSDFAEGKEHKVLGEVQLPLKKFLLVLKENDYMGALTIELDFENKRRNDIQNVEQAIEKIEKSLVIVKSILE